MAERAPALPVFVLMMGVSGAAMLVPAAHALARSDLATAQSFFFSAIGTAVLTLLIALATRDHRPRNMARSQLLTLFSAFTVLPALLAVPFHESVRAISFLDAWFEMLSSLTTTGATLWDNPYRLNPSVHVWRALVGWLGGFLIWVAAIAILAPLNLGGFEVQARGAPGEAPRGAPAGEAPPDPTRRLLRAARLLLPVYAGLTAALWIGLLLAGDLPTVAFCHALSTLSTSGISPIGGLYNGNSGIAGEILVFLFLAFALSRVTFSGRGRVAVAGPSEPIWRDPEIRMGAGVIGLVTLVLFLRHFLAAAEGEAPGGAASALSALWGSLFTATAFLTTAGFESRAWLDATDWSGLDTPGLILVGIALIGGGVATTAGGVKLLRVHALFMLGRREAERLIHPSSVGGAGQEARRIRREGAYVAWIFFMLFALSIVAVMLLLAMTGLQFETVMVLAVSAISNTGPLAQVAAENPISFAGLPDAAKMILAGTMVLGRLETLALIALLNPEFWRT
jgi:trk system potassium uptake protein TrkH